MNFETWEISQEVTRIENRIDELKEHIFEAKVNKRYAGMLQTLLKSNVEKLNILLGAEEI